MSKLAKLKEWMTLDSAANFLTNAFSEQVGISDIYQLALEGRLTLSVRLLMPVFAQHLLPAPVETALRAPSLDGKRTVVLDFIVDEKTVLKEDGDRVSIVGVFDFAMLGAERVLVERLYARSINSATPDMVPLEMVFLRDGAEGFYRLVSMFAIESEDGEEPVYGYSTTGYLPEDAQIVLRPSALTQLLQSEAESAENEKRRVVGTKERNTYLCVLAALCKEAKIDYSKPSKAAGNIRDIAQQKLGLAIGETTIENYLKAIPDALESRTK